MTTWERRWLTKERRRAAWQRFGTCKLDSAVVDHPNGGRGLRRPRLEAGTSWAHAKHDQRRPPSIAEPGSGVPRHDDTAFAHGRRQSNADRHLRLISIGELDRAIETANSGLMRLGDTEPLAAALHESAGFANKLSGRYGTAIGHFMRGATSQIHEVAAACAASGFLLTASLGRPRATAWFVSRSRDLGPDVIAPLVLKKAHLQGLRRPPDLDTRGAVRLVEFHNA